MMMTWIGTMGMGAIITMLFFYFLPTMIALARQHQNGLAIFILNLLLGWTMFGWIVALVWAFTVVDNKRIGQ